MIFEYDENKAVLINQNMALVLMKHKSYGKTPTLLNYHHHRVKMKKDF